MSIKHTINYNDHQFTLNISELSGKLSGFHAITTSCLDNKNCERLSKIPGSICSLCYAAKGHKRYKAAREYAINNGILLSTFIIPWDQLPIINDLYFRFESHGDLKNETQLINYINIARKNPDTHFALWTKHYHIIIGYLKKGGSYPKNMQLLLSSPFVNKDLSKQFINYIASFPGIDRKQIKAFTVYDREYAAAHDINVNCCDGITARRCIKCLVCYKDNPVDDVMIINETIHS